MKNQWPFWLFVIAIVIVVVISLNYQGKNEDLPLGDIFPEEQVFDYEYVKPKDQAKSPDAVKQEAPVKSEAAAPKTGMAPAAKSAPAPAVKKEPVPAAAVKKPEAASSSPVIGAYTIQVLSSQDQKALEKVLLKAKADGFSNAYIGTADLGEQGKWYRLYIGSYSSTAQARNDLPKVKEKYAQAFIIKLAK